MEIKVNFDTSEFQEELDQLENQIEQLGDTVDRLSEQGLRVKIKIAPDNNFLKRMVSVFSK